MEKYREVQNIIGTFLKSSDFKRRGNIFLNKKCGNWVYVGFQKSVSSKKDRAKFTINIGICSSVLRKWLESNQVEFPTHLDDCHWRKRIGFFMPGNQDFWWEIDNDTISTVLARKVIAVLHEKVLPEVDKYITDDRLEAVWLTGGSQGLTQVERFIFLTTLLKVGGSRELPRIAAEFKAC